MREPGRPLFSKLLGSADPLIVRILRGLGWTALGAAVARLISLAGSIAIARSLGRDDFGRYGIIQASVMTAAGLAGVSFGVAASRFMAMHLRKEPALAMGFLDANWGLALVAGLALSSGIFFSADWIASDALQQPSIAYDLRVASLAVAPLAIAGVQQGALVACEAFRQLAGLQALSGVLMTLLSCAGAAYSGVSGAVWGWVCSQFLVALMQWGAVRFATQNHLKAGRIRLSGAQSRDLLRFYIPHLAGSILNAPVGWLCQSLMVRQPEGLAAIAVYSATQKWREVVLFASTNSTPVTGVLLAEQVHCRDHQAASRTLVLATRGLVYSSILVAVPVAILGPWILSAYGPDYPNSGFIPLLLVLMAAITQAAAVPFSTLLTSAGHTRIGFWVATFSATSMVGTTLVLVKHGAVGLAAGGLSAAVVTACGAAIFGRLVLREIARSG